MRADKLTSMTSFVAGCISIEPTCLFYTPWYHTPPDTEGSIINEFVTATLAAASCPDSSEVTHFEHSPSRADSKIQNSLKSQK